MTDYYCVVTNNTVSFGFAVKSPSFVGEVSLEIGNVENPYPGGSTSEFSAVIGDDYAVPVGNSNVYLTANSFYFCEASFDGSLSSSNTGKLTITLYSVLPMPSSNYV